MKNWLKTQHSKTKITASSLNTGVPAGAQKWWGPGSFHMDPRPPCGWLGGVKVQRSRSDFGAQKNSLDTVSTVSPSISLEVMGPDAMIFVF